MKRTGITLVETLFVVLLAGVLLLMMSRIFRASSRASSQGFQQIDMVMEGQRIMKQVRADLESACITTASVSPELGCLPWMQASQENERSLSGTRWTMLVFPAHGPLETIMEGGPSSGSQTIRLDRVTYSLQSASASRQPFLQLIRTEQSDLRGGPFLIRKELSSRVQMFALQPVKVADSRGQSQWFFQVTLQLAEARDPAATSGSLPGEPVLNRTSGLMMADFFDLVCPTAFEATWNDPYLVPDWYPVFRKGPP